MDRHIISDIDIDGLDAIHMIRVLVNWLVKQVDVLLRRKKAELLDKKPGGLYEGHPTVIFVQMLRRVDNFGDTKNQHIYELRGKMNEALNDAVARYDHRILTINSCNSSSHFDLWGNLSHKGFRSLWYEIDDLLEHYDKNAVKLMPNPIRRWQQTCTDDCPEAYFTSQSRDSRRVVERRYFSF